MLLGHRDLTHLMLVLKYVLQALAAFVLHLPLELALEVSLLRLRVLILLESLG